MGKASEDMDSADYKVIKYPYFITKLHLYHFQIAHLKNSASIHCNLQS